MPTTTITAGTASSGLVQTAGNDGTLTLQVGSAGSPVNAMVSDATGQATLLKQPVLATAPSMIRLNTSNGYGSTNTCIRRFTNVVTSQGSDITYNSGTEATLGASFTINTSGVYSITYVDNFNGSASRGLTLNTITPTITITSCAIAEVLSIGTNSANYQFPTNWTGYLPAGSVIRPHADGVSTGTVTNSVQFTITRVA